MRRGNGNRGDRPITIRRGNGNRGDPDPGRTWIGIQVPRQPPVDCRAAASQAPGCSMRLICQWPGVASCRH